MYLTILLISILFLITILIHLCSPNFSHTLVHTKTWRILLHNHRDYREQSCTQSSLTTNIHSLPPNTIRIYTPTITPSFNLIHFPNSSTFIQIPIISSHHRQPSSSVPAFVICVFVHPHLHPSPAQKSERTKTQNQNPHAQNSRFTSLYHWNKPSSSSSSSSTYTIIHHPRATDAAKHPNSSS